MTKKSFKEIAYIFLIVCNFVLGCLTFYFASSLNTALEIEAPDFCGALVLITNTFTLLIFFIEQGTEYRSHHATVVTSLVGIALGIVFICTKPDNPVLAIEDICFYWGVFDIIKASIEISHDIPDVKKNKLTLIEIAIDVGDIVLGILLCLHLTHGIRLHIIYLGITLCLAAVKFVVDRYVIERRHKHE